MHTVGELALFTLHTAGELAHETTDALTLPGHARTPSGCKPGTNLKYLLNNICFVLFRGQNIWQMVCDDCRVAQRPLSEGSGRGLPTRLSAALLPPSCW
jgi:hypothetical protein